MKQPCEPRDYLLKNPAAYVILKLLPQEFFLQSLMHG